MSTSGCPDKTCSKCGTAKPVTEFHRDASAKDGMQTRCKLCLKKANAARYAADPARAKAASAAWRAANPEKNAATDRASYNARYAANPEKYAAINRARYAADREGNIARVTAWRNANRDKVQATQRAWNARHPEAARTARRNRRALKSTAGGRLPRDIVQRLFAKQNGLCACCLADLRVTGHHIDHIAPLSRGGTNTEDNVQLLTPKCNLSKGARAFGEYLASKTTRGNTHGPD